MNPPRVNVNALPDTVLDLLPVIFVGVPQGKLALGDEMRREAGVGVRRVVRVSALCQRRCWWEREAGGTYGPSLQVKTWSKPQERTLSSSGLLMMAVSSR